MNYSRHLLTVRRTVLVLLLIGATACTDPLDRQQGEPGAFEDSGTQNENQSAPAGEDY